MQDEILRFFSIFIKSDHKITIECLPSDAHTDGCQVTAAKEMYVKLQIHNKSIPLLELL